MFKFTSKFSDDFKTEASSISNPVLPDDYSFLITEFKVVKQSRWRDNLPWNAEFKVVKQSRWRDNLPWNAEFKVGKQSRWRDNLPWNAEFKVVKQSRWRDSIYLGMPSLKWLNNLVGETIYLGMPSLKWLNNLVGETQFTLECRVNSEAKDDIDKLLLDIGRKSGTTYNKLRGDRQGKGTKVIVSGIRKYHHGVTRHSLKDTQPHSGAGRQPGCEKIPGKDTCCPAKLQFSLPGEGLYTSDQYRLSITKQNKTNYPLELKLDYLQNHCINSADAMRYRPVSKECQDAFAALLKEDHTPSAFQQ